jgi:sulfatase maturation enzyme AslB (radical SAM superfamily)
MIDKDFLLKKSKTFCMAPWVEVHVTTIGRVFPCCAAETDEYIGDISIGDTLEESWNSERAKKLRLDILQENKNPLCIDCYTYENLDRNSERDWYNIDFLKYWDRVEMTKDDGELEIFDPPFIDIRFSNVCNFRCRICSPQYSTAWYKDAKKLGQLTDEKKIITPTENPQELWEQVETLIPTIERIHFAGGEPLVMEEHYRILKMLLDAGKTDVKITYNTNFADLTFKGESVLDYWKEFKQVNVGASLDGMGKRGDYMRKGQDWNKIVENRKLMKKICGQHNFHIVCSVSMMNVLHIPDFYRWGVDTEFISPGNISLYYVAYPYLWDIKALPVDKKQEILDKYNAFIEEYLRGDEYYQSIRVEEDLRAILS